MEDQRTKTEPKWRPVETLAELGKRVTHLLTMADLLLNGPPDDQPDTPANIALVLIAVPFQPLDGDMPNGCATSCTLYTGMHEDTLVSVLKETAFAIEVRQRRLN